jgi:hypothetical protein
MTNTTRPLITIHNVSTDEVVTREMNDAEYAQHLIDLALFEEEQTLAAAAKAEADAAAEAKKAAKAQALAALGLSQEVVNLLAE